MNLAPAFDYMIAEGLFEYVVNSYTGGITDEHYRQIRYGSPDAQVRGQVNHAGQIFVVSRRENPSEGRDGGWGPEFNIVRIRPVDTPTTSQGGQAVKSEGP